MSQNLLATVIYDFIKTIKLIHLLGSKNQNAGFIVSQSSILMLICMIDGKLSNNKKIQNCLLATKKGFFMTIAGSEKGVNSRKPRALIKQHKDHYILKGKVLYGELGFNDSIVPRGKEYVTGLDQKNANKILVFIRCHLNNNIATVVSWADAEGIEIIETPFPFFVSSDTNALRLHDVKINKKDVFLEGEIGKWSNIDYRNSAMLMLGIIANHIGLAKGVLDYTTEQDEFILLRKKLKILEKHLFLSADYVQKNVLNLDKPEYSNGFSRMLKLKIRLHYYVRQFAKNIKKSKFIQNPKIKQAIIDLETIYRLAPLEHYSAINYLRHKDEFTKLRCI